MSLGITVCHHSASLVMPNGDPRDGLFYPTLTLMIDSYNFTGHVSVMGDLLYHDQLKLLSGNKI